jgi:hypothetical protein
MQGVSQTLAEKGHIASTLNNFGEKSSVVILYDQTEATLWCHHDEPHEAV